MSETYGAISAYLCARMGSFESVILIVGEAVKLENAIQFNKKEIVQDMLKLKAKPVSLAEATNSCPVA